MKIIPILRQLSKRIFPNASDHVIYAYDKHIQGDGKLDPSVEIYDARNPPSPEVRDWIRLASGRLGYWFMFRRMVRYGGKLLCIRKDDRLAA